MPSSPPPSMFPTRRHRLINLLQSALFLAAMGALGWGILRAIAGPEWGALLLPLALLALLAAPAVPPRWLLAAYGAIRLDHRSFPAGLVLITILARRAGLPRPPELWYVPSRLPNAFAVGRREESVICLTDGLLRLLNERELAAVLAHEVAHIAHGDLRIMALADVMSRVVAVASWMGLFTLLLNLPLLAAGQRGVPWEIVLLLVFAPTVMALLQLALSRSREYDADLGAVRLTGDIAGLIRALHKLEGQGYRLWEGLLLPTPRIPEPSLLRTHPPTEARIARLRALAAEAAASERFAMPAALPWAAPALPPPPRFHRGHLFYY